MIGHSSHEDATVVERHDRHGRADIHHCRRLDMRGSKVHVAHNVNVNVIGIASRGTMVTDIENGRRAIDV